MERTSRRNLTCIKVEYVLSWGWRRLKFRSNYRATVNSGVIITQSVITFSYKNDASGLGKECLWNFNSSSPQEHKGRKSLEMSCVLIRKQGSCTFPHDFSICTKTDSLFPPTKFRSTPKSFFFFFELFNYDYRHEGRSGGHDVIGQGNVNEIMRKEWGYLQISFQYNWFQLQFEPGTPRIKVKYYIVALVLIYVDISFQLISSFHGTESTDESR